MSWWIKCSERTPDHEDDYLVYAQGFGACVMGYTMRDGRYVWEDEDVYYEMTHASITHWMPLPEPPKETM